MPEINNYDDVNKKVLELSKHESFIAKKEAAMNEAIQKVKDKFDQETADARAAKLSLESEIQSFCAVNKKDFANKRTKKLMFGEVGFRTGTPKVLILNRKYNTKTVLELIRKIFNGKYIRKKEEFNKDEILAAYAKEELDDAQLAAVGLKIDQDENFFVKIDWEKLEEAAA